MSIELCVLASGSSGNCSVLRTPGGAMLIDAGIGPRLAANRLAGTGVDISHISSVCLTHLDSDHFSSTWAATLIRLGIRVFCHERCIEQLRRMVDDDRINPLLNPFGHDAFEPLPGLTAQAVALVHDWEGSHGFVIEGHGQRLGYATDLGRVTDSLVEQFVDLDLLALESNYDPQMQQVSTRPAFLKRRVTGGRGHLSNEQALDAIRRMLTRSERRAGRLPAHIVLLHRSRQCNCPALVRRLFSADERIAPRLVLAEQHARTEWLSVPARPISVGEQMLLAWG